MSAPEAAEMACRLFFKLILVVIQVLLVIYFAFAAYSIRLYPIQDYGMIIHEFDPWFNYRATEYLAEHGLSRFFKWYDYMSWYPIGRPIGTTIYPGMQMTGVAIWEVMKLIPPFTYNIPKLTPVIWSRRLLKILKQFNLVSLPFIPKKIVYAPMSVNDICCMMPPWFGSIAAL